MQLRVRNVVLADIAILIFVIGFGYIVYNVPEVLYAFIGGVLLGLSLIGIGYVCYSVVRLIRYFPNRGVHRVTCPTDSQTWLGHTDERLNITVYRYPNIFLRDYHLNDTSFKLTPVPYIEIFGHAITAKLTKRVDRAAQSLSDEIKTINERIQSVSVYPDYVRVDLGWPSDSKSWLSRSDEARVLQCICQRAGHKKAKVSYVNSSG